MILSIIVAVVLGVAAGFGLHALLAGVPYMAVFLLMMGGAAIGYFGGMLFMRDSYLSLLMAADRRADEQRRIGYAVGLRMSQLPGRK